MTLFLCFLDDASDSEINKMKYDVILTCMTLLL